MYLYSFECEQIMCNKLEKFYAHNVEQEEQETRENKEYDLTHTHKTHILMLFMYICYTHISYRHTNITSI